MFLDESEELLGDIDYQAFHERLESTVFVVHNILSSKKSFKRTFKELYDYMKQGFEKPEVRKHPLRFRFRDDEREPYKELEIRHFIINLMYWYPFLVLDKVKDLNDSHVYWDARYPTLKSSVNYINNKIIIPYREEIEMSEISAALDDLVYLASRINKDFAVIMATTLDVESFSELRRKYPRFKELTETIIPDGMQPKEIEDLLDKNLNEYIDIIVNDEDNNLKAFLVTGVGINKKQLSQFAINGGLKPDIEGNVIPIPINSNFITGGLNSISNFYIDGQAGCKPLILNKTIMGKSGHFAYKTMTLASGYRLSQTVHDCHSKRPIRFIVKDDEHLKRIKGRYYVDEDGVLRVIKYKRDKHLIGKTIMLRDPVTCCAHDGICHVCYGDLYYTNKDPAFHIGKFAATQYNNPIEQKILSSKHMNATRSNIIEFDENFSRFFILEANKIKLNPDSDEEFKNWTLLLNEDGYFVVDDMSSDSDFNCYTETFYLYNKVTGENVPIKDKSGHDMFFYSEIAQMFSKKDEDRIGVSLGKLDYENPIAIINIANNELSTPLKNIMKLLDRVNHFGCDTIDDMVNKICDLAIESDISVDNVHGSLLIKGLVRRSDDILLSPDFSDAKGCENYQILTLTNALIYNPSLTVSMSFESLNKQITNPHTYRKYKPSDYDLSYKKDLYADSQKFYERLKEEKRLKHIRSRRAFHKKKKKK